MNHIQANGITGYMKENGGRAIVLFLLFLLAIYELLTSGLNNFAIVCALPLIALAVYIGFKYKMFIFWFLFVFNYFVMFFSKMGYLNIQASLPNELMELLLIFIAIIDYSDFKGKNLNNLMLLALVIWVGFCTLEVLNDTCDIGININAWYKGARLMAFQLLYAFIVCSLYINSPKRLKQFLYAWAILSFFAVYWAWKQKTFGFNAAENNWLYAQGHIRQHFVNGIMRYFSVFNDAAVFGCHMAAASVAFYIISITSKLKRDKIFFLISGVACTWAMFTSGTRTAIFCMIVGFILYIFLSKSVKIAVPVTIIFGLFICMLAFTKIGQGNNQIRRMRTAFDKNDASASVRDVNKESMKKYVRDAPWGMGIGLFTNDIPAFNKYKILSETPPDSEYVFIWVHTGVIGITVFIITTILMLFGACWVVLFRIKNRSLCGIGAAFCCAFVSIHLGGYGNQILMQFPNVIIFYGGLSLVYILPLIEKDYQALENNQLKLQAERKEAKLKKKRESRV